jgi:hypothetical protein
MLPVTLFAAGAMDRSAGECAGSKAFARLGGLISDADQIGSQPSDRRPRSGVRIDLPG